MLIERVSFTHLAELIQIEDSLKRTFYEIECLHGNWSVRDPYVFEFLGLKSKEVMGESDLENALLDYHRILKCHASLSSRPTAQNHVYVDDIREQGPARIGRANEFRLTENRAKGTQSVFKFDGKGTVGKSTHTGIPWLRFLRRHPDLRGRLHFWPFDGYEVPRGRIASDG